MAKENRPILQEEAQKIELTNYLDYRDYLMALYKRMKAMVQPYSYLQYAYDLSFSRTNVIRLIITGDRSLSMKASAKIARALELKGQDRRYFTTMVKYQLARLPAERDKIFKAMMKYKTQLAPKAMDPLMVEYYSRWYNPIIRELAGLKGFKGDPEWIQKHLTFPLRLEEVKRSLKLLSDIGFLVWEDEAERYKKPEQILTEPEVDGMAIILYHQKMMEMASQSITTVQPADREIRAVTVSLKKQRIEELKRKILDWSMEIMAMEDEDDQADRVYQMNFQLFPFTAEVQLDQEDES